MAYTSASTALNQWLSVNANVKEPTNALPKATIISLFSLILPRQCKIILTMIKYNNMQAKALTIGDIILTLKAISGLVGNMENIRPRIKYRGLPGGWGTPKI